MLGRPTSLVLALVLGGCAARTPAQAMCDEAPLLVAPDEGCVELEVTADETRGCEIIGPDGEVAQRVTGAWIKLHRAAIQGATVRVRLLSTATCALDGHDCPVVIVGGVEDEPCSCARYGEAYPNVIPPPDDPDYVWEREMVRESETLIVAPAGASFAVSLCASDVDPFPVCHPAASSMCPPGIGQFVSTLGCACEPSCTVSTDCPLPFAAASVSCFGGRCVLACTTSADCRPEEECVDITGAPRCLGVR